VCRNLYTAKSKVCNQSNNPYLLAVFNDIRDADNANLIGFNYNLLLTLKINIKPTKPT
jgi:hypothetical protein